MRRSLTIAGCLIVLLAPAVASASSTTRDLAKGAVVLGYSGEARRTIPTGTYCAGTNPCIDYGEDLAEGNWHVTVLFDRNGVSRTKDTLLRAYVKRIFTPDYENPGTSRSPYPPCEVSVYDNDERYAKGAFMTPTARSLGFQLSLPIDSQWMQPLDKTDPKNCGWGGDYTGVGVFGAASYGPKDPAQTKKLGLAGIPQFAIRKRDKSITKHFDFHYKGTDTAPDGIAALTSIDIVSSVTVINGCRRVYLPTHRCLARY